MARQCAICGKKSILVGRFKKLRGKYNPVGKKKKYPNLQWITLSSGLPAGQAGKREKACVKCIRALAKKK